MNIVFVVICYTCRGKRHAPAPVPAALLLRIADCRLAGHNVYFDKYATDQWKVGEQF
jgi:hypothetical protein